MAVGNKKGGYISLTEKEINDIEIAEQICGILSNKNKNTPKDAAEALEIPITEVEKIIKDNNLYFKAAYLKHDREIFAIEAARKSLKKREVEAKYILEESLRNLQNKHAE